MKKLGVAIVGCGVVYKAHADSLVDNEHSELVAVTDISEEKANEASKLYRCKAYVTYKDLLKDDQVDVVHICTPHYLHVPMALEALEAGKHVLLEKPAGINASEIKELIEKIKITKNHVGVCFQNRYNYTSIVAKRILEEGSLGAVKGIKGIVTWNREASYYTESNWRGIKDKEGGGVMINQAIHTLDLMQWLVGEVEKLKGVVDNRTLQEIIQVEDTAEATLFFKNGAKGVFYATNAFSTNSPVNIEIHCSKGILQLSNEELIRYADNKKEFIVKDEQDTIGGKGYWGISHGVLIRKFHKSILENDYNGYIDVEEGTKVNQLIEAIYKSSDENKYIKIMEESD